MAAARYPTAHTSVTVLASATILVVVVVLPFLVGDDLLGRADGRVDGHETMVRIGSYADFVVAALMLVTAALGALGVEAWRLRRHR